MYHSIPATTYLLLRFRGGSIHFSCEDPRTFQYETAMGPYVPVAGIGNGTRSVPTSLCILILVELTAVIKSVGFPCRKSVWLKLDLWVEKAAPFAIPVPSSSSSHPCQARIRLLKARERNCAYCSKTQVVNSNSVSKASAAPLSGTRGHDVSSRCAHRRRARYEIRHKRPRSVDLRRIICEAEAS